MSDKLSTPLIGGDEGYKNFQDVELGHRQQANSSLRARGASVRMEVPALGGPRMSIIHTDPNRKQSILQRAVEVTAHAVGAETGEEREIHTQLAIPRHYSEIKSRASLKIDARKAGVEVQLPQEAEPASSEAAKEKKKVGSTSKDYELDDHKIPLDELARRLNSHIDVANMSSSQGLTTQTAQSRLAAEGRNVLTPPPQTPEWIKFLSHFIDLFMILLEAAGVLCFIGYGVDPHNPDNQSNLYLGIILFAIVILTCTISYIQERSSSAVMESFKKMLPASTRVIRDGKETRVAAEELVRGDLVVLTAGDKIPADVRIIHCNGLKVDNSSLTGESEPIPCGVECTDENPLETHNLAFYSTLALDGSAKGIVVRTGDGTLIGKIATLASSSDNKEKPTLEVEIQSFVRFISYLAFAMGIVFAIIQALRLHKGQTWTVVVINTIGIIVANVPEGLPATVTACLTITARKMAEKNVYIKELSSIETLGSTTLIASDKTGTLTQNRMSAAHMWYDGGIVSTDSSLSAGKFDQSAPTCANLIRIAACCNRSEFDMGKSYDDDGHLLPIAKRPTLGDASESALLRFCEALSPIDQTRAATPKVFEIPFNSTNKWQLSIHKMSVQDSAPRILLMKGAPERIIDLCSKYMQDGREHEITEDFRKEFEAAYEKLGGMGERVLGFAQIQLDPSKFSASMDSQYNAKLMNFPTTGLTFVGLISLIDPPKPSVPDAIAKCHTAGIRVVMVTGDHPLTAKAIAKQIGIIKSETADEIAAREGIPVDQVPDHRVSAVVVNGSQIAKLQKEDWDRIMSKKEIVFARTSPQQKLLIVSNFKERGEIVAVTGDGVNDSPALKQANIGVAMGIMGSDVSKEAAKIILMDDDFASIVTGVEQGRVIFDNLRKSIAYTLAHLIPEIIPFLINIIANVPLGLSAMLILFIDLGTEMAPAISLAYEEAEADIMNRPPRNAKTDRMVTWQTLLYSYVQMGIIECGSCFFVYLFVFKHYGIPLSFLPGSAVDYFQTGAPNLVFDGKIFTDADQIHILYVAEASYFFTIVLMQIVNLLICKTRTQSLFTHGLRNNSVNVAILIELVIAVFVVFTPFMQTYIGTGDLCGPAFVGVIPGFIAAFIMFEIRKYIQRKNPRGFIAKYIAW